MAGADALERGMRFGRPRVIEVIEARARVGERGRIQQRAGSGGGGRREGREQERREGRAVRPEGGARYQAISSRAAAATWSVCGRMMSSSTGA
jgi:hypothetical protein